jgi:hypothetical protein
MGGKDKSASISEQQLALQRESLRLQGKGMLIDADASITSIRGELEQNKIDIADYTTQISSYDQWLNNYGNLYDMETTAKDAEIAQFKQSGLESYQNFMNALGGADAVAGMTGRVGAGTSMALASGQIGQRLESYTGADRSLEGDDGIYGQQAKVQELQKADLITDLENQYTSMSGQKTTTEEAKARAEKASAEYEKNLKSAQAERARLQEYVNSI